MGTNLYQTKVDQNFWVQIFWRQIFKTSANMWGQSPGDGHLQIQQALRRWHQRNRIPRGPKPPAARLHQGNFSFFCDVIFMTDPLHFLVTFFPLQFLQEQVAACCLQVDARSVVRLPGITPVEHDKIWVIVEDLCVKVIHEVKGAEYVHTH